jgi:diadenosine tetraphosphate (Ap4A) HIT family hydrolase
MGHRTYLACTQTEELVDGHCLIVPLQHHLSMLEMDDDEWDEVRVRNFYCPLSLDN